MLIVLIKQYKPEFAMYVSLICGILILFLAMDKLISIIDVIKSIANRSSINSSFLLIILKITGIAIISEFAVSVCNDSGESAIASKIEIGSKVIIVYLSIPIISNLLDVVLNILP